ncbi:MAG: hypothetical protein KDD60_10125 [Bdellovibrionales bacterium]|nr:hypothetical protein [Bdellovibrionales bacterium]
MFKEEWRRSHKKAYLRYPKADEFLKEEYARGAQGKSVYTFGAFHTLFYIEMFEWVLESDFDELEALPLRNF